MASLRKTFSKQIPFIRSAQIKKTIVPTKSFSIGKRQRFVIAVIVLTIFLFVSEYFFTGYGFWLSFLLAFITVVCFYLSMRLGSKDDVPFQSFVLPFLYSLAVGLFYLLTPARLLTKVVLTSLYAIGLYSLFLSENIFTVAAIRTIALLNGARIVSFVISLISYFFLTNIIFSLRINIIVTSILLYVFTFFFILHSMWSYSLEKNIFQDITWTMSLSLCLLQLGIILWFWPTTPTVVALFLTGVLYILVGLAHIWFDRRLFKGILWEYMWVGSFVFFVLIAFTNWQ